MFTMRFIISILSYKYWLLSYCSVWRLLTCIDFYQCTCSYMYKRDVCCVLKFQWSNNAYAYWWTTNTHFELLVRLVSLLITALQSILSYICYEYRYLTYYVVKRVVLCGCWNANDLTMHMLVCWSTVHIQTHYQLLVRSVPYLLIIMRFTKHFIICNK